jgi:hypothetical protein
MIGLKEKIKKLIRFLKKPIEKIKFKNHYNPKVVNYKKILEAKAHLVK